MQGSRVKNFDFDYETCFADGDHKKQSRVEDYRWDFVKAHSRIQRLL